MKKPLVLTAFLLWGQSVFGLAPSAISNLTALAGDATGQVNLTWTAPGGDGETGVADDYYVRYSTTGQINNTVDFASATIYNQSWPPQAFGTSESQSITGLTPGVTYYFAIRASHNTNGIATWVSSANVNSANVARAQYISALTWSGDSVVLSSGSIKWAWNDVGEESGYRVFNSTSNENRSGNLSQNTTTFTDATLTPNTTYSYFHQAYDGSTSLNSAASTYVTLSVAPGNLSSPGQTNTTLTLTWDRGENPSGTLFDLERSTNGTGNWSAILSLSTASAAIDTSLNENTTYFYRTRSWNHAAVASTYAVVAATQTQWIPPNSISSLNASPGTNDGEVNLIWTAPGNDDTSGTVLDYWVRYATFNVTGANFDDPTVSSFTHSWSSLQSGGNPESRTITGLTPSVTYYFAIRGVDSGGAASYSSAANPNRADYATDLVPPVPTGVGVTQGAHSNTISWTAVSGIPDLEGYWVERATASNFDTVVVLATVPAVQTSTTDVSLANQSTYYYRVRSVDTAPVYLYSSYSSIVSTVTLDADGPDPVSIFSASQGNVEGELEFTWVWTGDDGLTGNIIGGEYRIQASLNALESWSPANYTVRATSTGIVGATHSVIASSLSPGATYYARMWLYDEAGNISSLSSAATAWAQVDVTPPANITSLALAARWRQIDLSWSAPGDDGTTKNLFGTYEIAYSSVADITNLTEFQNAPGQISVSTNIAPGSSVGHSITGLTNGVTYYVSIRSLDESGNASNISSSLNTFPYNSVPAAFSLTSPPDNSISSIDQPIFDWGDSSDADAPWGDQFTYTLQYSSSSGFEAAVTTTTTNILVSSYTPMALAEDQTIYWRVTVIDSDGAQVAGSPDPMRVRINVVNSTPTLPSLVSPANEGITTTQNVPLDWADSTDSDPGDTVSYLVELSLSPTFSTLTHSSSSAVSSLTMNGLTENVTYYWRVTATDSVLSTRTASSWFAVNANDEAPNTFTLLTPVDNTSLTTLTPTLTWEDTLDPDPGDSFQFVLVYSYLANFASSTTVVLTTTTYTLPTQPDNVNIYWFVQAVDNDNVRRTSTDSFQFAIDIGKQSPNAFNLVSPTNTITLSTLRPVFDWDDAVDPDPTDTVRYSIELSVNDPSFSGVQGIPTGADSFYVPTNDLVDHSTYYWRVYAGGYQGIPPVLVDAGLTVSPTFILRLDTVNVPPSNFGLTSPSEGASVTSQYPTFTWEASTDTSDDYIRYSVTVSSLSDLSLVAVSTSGLATESWTSPTKLTEQTTYYWSVTAVDKSSVTTVSNSTNSFYVPILTRPRAPDNVMGTLSGDSSQWTLTWTVVSENNDGTTANDLVGYHIYRSTSLDIIDSGTPFDTLTLSATSWTDGALGGIPYFYMIRTYDDSAVESYNSVTLRAERSPMLYVVSARKDLTIGITESAANALNSAGGIARRVSLVENAGTSGRTLASYQLRVEKVDGAEEVTNYKFTEPIQLSFSLPKITASVAAKNNPSASAVTYSATDAGVYWNNGVEYIKMGGNISSNGETLALSTIQSGLFEVRQVQRAGSFSLSRIYPKKIFTPNDDGVNDVITFVFDNPTDAPLSGKIFNIHGGHIGNMAVGLDGSSLEWNGRDTSGGPVDKGVYIYEIEADGNILTGTIVVAR